jgi:hypothetical protein
VSGDVGSGTGLCFSSRDRLPLDASVGLRREAATTPWRAALHLSPQAAFNASSRQKSPYFSLGTDIPAASDRLPLPNKLPLICALVSALTTGTFG